MICIFSQLFSVKVARKLFCYANCGLRRESFFVFLYGTPYSFFILFLPRGRKTSYEKSSINLPRILPFILW